MIFMIFFVSGSGYHFPLLLPFMPFGNRFWSPKKIDHRNGTLSDRICLKFSGSVYLMSTTIPESFDSFRQVFNGARSSKPYKSNDFSSFGDQNLKMTSQTPNPPNFEKL